MVENQIQQSTQSANNDTPSLSMDCESIESSFNECDVCGETFEDPDGLKDHLKTHIDEEVVINIAIKEEPTDDQNGVKEVELERDKQFKSQVENGTDQEGHDVKQHECSVCGTTLKTAGDLTMHLLSHCSKEAPHTCVVCAKSYPYRHTLKGHLRTHSGEQPFKCSVCGKNFTEGSNLKLHMRIHSGEKPFKCLHCNKSFISKYKLKRHMTAHGDKELFTEGEPMYDQMGVQHMVQENNETEVGTDIKREMNDCVLSLGNNIFQETGQPLIKNEPSSKDNDILQYQAFVEKEQNPQATKDLKEDNLDLKNCVNQNAIIGREFNLETAAQHDTKQENVTSKAEKRNLNNVSVVENETLQHKVIKIELGESTQWIETVHSKMKAEESELYAGSQETAQCSETEFERNFDETNQGTSLTSTYSTTCNFQDTVIKIEPEEPASEEEERLTKEQCPDIITIDLTENPDINETDELDNHGTAPIGEQQPLRCSLCAETLKTTRDLTEHLLNHCGNAPPYSCVVCTKPFPYRHTLRGHLRIHTGEQPFKCSVCGKNFTEGSNLKSHFRIHSGERPFKCLHCNSGFISKYKLERHMASRHTEKQLYSCLVCGRNVNSKESLVKHMKVHSNDHADKPHKCSVCEKMHVSKAALKKHMASHIEERSHLCATCGKSFTTIALLKSHMKTHNTEKPHRCTTCGESFATAPYLKIHQIKHVEEKSHACLVCGKMFTSNRYLLRHIKTHSDDKPHVCSTCGQSFKMRTTLTNHIATHSDDLPHKCWVCESAFRLKETLDTHMRTHTGEKPFKCSICAKKFRSHSQLSIHKRTHSGRKPHGCSVCGKYYSDKRNRDHHMKTQHGHDGETID